MLRIRALETSDRLGAEVTAIGIVLALTELAEIRTEIREDLAALSDELAALRRHMNDHLAALRSEMLHRLGTLR